MRKMTVDIIVPDGYDLNAVSTIIQSGCYNAVLTNDEGRLTKLRPEVVVESPRNDSHLTLVLTERRDYEHDISDQGR